jgi:GT2 family glycosyltransferase
MRTTEKLYLIRHKYRLLPEHVRGANTFKIAPSSISELTFHIDRIASHDYNAQLTTVSSYPELLLVEGWVLIPEHLRNNTNIYVESAGIGYKSLQVIARQDVAVKKKRKGFFALGFSTLIINEFLVEGTNRMRLLVGDENDCLATDWVEFKKAIALTHEAQEAAQYAQALNDRVNSMYTSLSWRLTQPLRMALDLIIQATSRSSFKKINNQQHQRLHTQLKGVLENTRLKVMLQARSRNRAALAQKAYEKMLIKKNEVLSAHEFHYNPMISVVVPVYNVEPRWLERCVNSVLNQTYARWELCLYDDASTNHATVGALKKIEGLDARIKVKYGTVNLHIAEASNQAINLCAGEYIALLDNDDEIAPYALAKMVEKLNQQPDLDYIFSDEDKLEMDETRTGPYFKPGINLSLFFANNYFCHFSLIRKTVGDKVGWFRKGFEGSQDYDLFLRIVDETNNIGHISEVLYSWRKIPGSTASEYSEKSYANDSSIKALTDHLTRTGASGKVVNGLWPGSFRIKYDLGAAPLISIIIPFKDQAELLRNSVLSILEKTNYHDFEIILLNNNSVQLETTKVINELCAEEKVQMIDYSDPFNFSAINNYAASIAKGEYLVFLNNDTEVIAHDWLGAMLEQAHLSRVGCVGAKLLYQDCTVQHAGVILGVGGIATHAFHGFWEEDNYYFGNLNVIREYAAISAACMMVNKQLFLDVGGFDKELAVAYNDVDLCLKLRDRGLVNVYTPFAKLFHFESKSRGYDTSQEKQQRLNTEAEYLLEKWGDKAQIDPYFNPNFDTARPDFSIAT